MSRHPQRTAARRERGWLSFFVGLILGLSVALFVYLRPDSVANQGLGPVAAGRDPPSPRPPEPEEAGTSKPRFDFYTILPEREVKVPEWEATPQPEPNSPPESKTPSESERPPAAVPPSGLEASGSYMIQVGSFQRYQDADRVKARLALAGVAAGIQRVVINGSDVWYRVRVGPFNDLKSLQGARQRLTEGRFNYMLVKVKPGEGAG
ncbi:MAG: SPOR domain-containing protein [Pseudomonadota bacterium]|nr:SPOR domain-containing protein [Pseudomonadota bacterium]